MIRFNPFATSTPTSIVDNEVVVNIDTTEEEIVEIQEEPIDYIEQIEKNMNRSHNVDIDKTVSMEDFFQTTKDDYDDFDAYCYRKGDGYKIPTFPSMEKYLEGVESGLYLLAAESNCGKTGLMLNILESLTSYAPNKLFGIYFSLDDARNEIIPRVIAMNQEIPIAVAGKPRRFENLLEKSDPATASLIQAQLEKRKKGLQHLKDISDRFKIEDGDKIKNSSDIEKYIANVQTYVKSIDPEMNVAVVIDALNDVVLDKEVFGRVDKEDRVAEASKFLKATTKKFDIFMLSSCHLRKLNGNRRPTVDDLREANTVLYEASVVWLLFNDVSKNSANSKIFFDDPDADGRLGAVIEMDWGKNKKSSFKGRTFFKFKPNFSKLVECGIEESKRFESLIMQA